MLEQVCEWSFQLAQCWS